MIDFSLFNTLDWIVVSILVWSVISGVWFGFSNEIFGLIGLIGAFVITAIAGHWLDGPLESFLPHNAMGHMFARVIVFIGCILLIHIMMAAMAEAMREVLSRPVDHSLGLFFGFARGAIIILLPFLLVNLYIDPKVYPDWLVEAQSYPYLSSGARALRTVIPDSEINDRKRTDFSELDKLEEVAQKQEEKVKTAAKDAKKDKKIEDSTGNSKWKDVIEGLKENLPN